MGDDDVSRKVSHPARGARGSVEAELSERILNDTGAEPGALPLMAFALEQLYDKRISEGQPTHAAYEKLGGVKDTISQRAEDTFRTLDDDAKATLESVFRELVLYGLGASDLKERQMVRITREGLPLSFQMGSQERGSDER